MAKKAAERGITLLPGAELSFNAGKGGLHILAIFAADADLAGINHFFQSLDRDSATPLFSDDRSHRDISLKINLVDALRGLKERFNCLLIPPHPDQSNGLCKILAPQQVVNFLTEIRPDGLEHCPQAEIHRLTSTGNLPPGFWDSLSRRVL